eukprot:CAMPEP_0205818552 /NCGR_PEP_ID=MMETSP0206-20130828/478_1 /ASSEMBLY_ACC=CAM_ASM_000279 /TAXON_ID=36767 /ORGANISM="Euplotes focardii, Strain TN1" /LENGTH=395 /DNA_ID=CAMNT_0053110993 /DNA_START=23 /DNA_END=1210 /DNA_ORIENTATION=+
MMKLLALALVCASAAAFVDDEIIEGEFIVVLKKHLAPQLRANHMSKFRSTFNDSLVTVTHEFNINKGQFQAYIVKGLSEEAAMALPQKDATVAYVEPHWVQHVTDEAACETQSRPANWGLARMVHNDALPAPAEFHFTERNGQGVEVHVLDTGIHTTHEDYDGRATWVGGGDHVNEGENDQHGHGTHVASTVGGILYGSARASTLIAQKVCNRRGSCPANAQLAALELVAAAASRAGGNKVVGNMSLGGRFRQASNDAVNAVVDAGAVMVVSAGNSNNNACTLSPASAEKAYTVMAMDSSDRRSSFSSFGSCCQIFAPGTAITAAWTGSDTATRTVSGTSMSSPMTAGGMATLWSKFPSDSNVAIQARLSAQATMDVITNPGANSPNALLFDSCQ